MTDLVDALLAGPRGRRLCLELAQGPHGRAWTPQQDDLWKLRFSAEAARSTTSVRYSSSAPSEHELDEIGPDASDSGEPEGTDEDEDEWSVPSTEEVAAALDAVGTIPVDELALLLALMASTDSARPWGEPDVDDLLLAEPPMAGPLRRIAEWIAASDAARWLTEPLSDELWGVDFDVSDNLRPEPPFPARADALEEWRTERIDASGYWWCTPPWPVPTTTRLRPGLGPIGLWAVVDSFGWSTATVTRATTPLGARVYEVTGAESWAELCRAYPLDLADSVDEWRLCTGWQGRWVLPDWSLAARDIDAVHLTGAAYLATAETAVPVSPGRASVITGWAPDHTYWLTGGPTLSDETARWRLDEENAVWAPDDESTLAT